MENKLTKQIKILTSNANNLGKLSVHEIFNIFMDISSEHGDYLKVSAPELAKKGLFWVISKTKIKINKYPMLLEDIEVCTWPVKPELIRYYRHNTISQNNQVIIECKTEWLVLEMNTNRIYKGENVYPKELNHLENTVCVEPFYRFTDTFDSCDKEQNYVVKSTDIDIAQHMNNVSYVKMVMGMFSCKQLEQMDISEIEIHYKEQCYEQENLTVKFKNVDSGIIVGVFKPNGKLACNLFIKTKVKI